MLVFFATVIYAIVNSCFKKQPSLASALFIEAIEMEEKFKAPHV